MADVIEQAVDLIKQVFTTGQKAVVSGAPGAGPESERADHRVAVERAHSGRLPLGYLASVPAKGNTATGYGGSGDPAILDTQPEAEVDRQIRDLITRSKQSRLRDVKPSGRVRFSKAFSLTAHMEWTGLAVADAFSYFANTTGVPSAGNSLQQIPLTLPIGALSPAFLLDRYPGAMYMSVFVKSFSLQPLTAGMTGLQECFFIDPGGAVVGLGIYNPANVSADQYQNISTLCATPITDPGLNQVGTLMVNNIGLATPVASRFALNLSYIAFYADPWFNEQMVVPPTPAEIFENLRTMEASG